MKNPIDHIKESADEIRLTSEEYTRMRSRLVAHMRLHPAVQVPIASPYHRFLGVLSPFASALKKPVAVALIAVLMVGGGASTYAAKGALPGDMLYPIKVSVLEPTRKLLAPTPEAKAELQASFATQRIREVEQLAVRGKITPEQEEESSKQFEQSYTVAQATIQKLSEQNPEAAANVREKLADALDTHSAVLDVLSTATVTERNHQETRSFAVKVQDKLAAEAREDSAARAAGPTLMSAALVQDESARSTKERGRSEEKKKEIEETLKSLGITSDRSDLQGE